MVKSERDIVAEARFSNVNLLQKIEDLSIDYHLPKFHLLCQNSYGIETIIKLILLPLRVDPLLSG